SRAFATRDELSMTAHWLASLHATWARLPWWNWALQILGLVSSYYIGAELNTPMRVQGFYVWLLAHLALFAVHLSSGLWALALLDMAYFRINIRGIRHWRRQAA
ncbi:MAG: hypothetical protein ACP5RC_06420, partial [Halothiobacillaceae bacterium]